MKKSFNYFLFLFFAFLFLIPQFASATIDTLTIAQAREDLNSDLIPDRLGDTVVVYAVVNSPNYQTSNESYYIWDGTAGITTFLGGTTGPVLNLEDSVQITGVIDQFNGLTELVPLADSSVIYIDCCRQVPPPVILTIGDYLANAEMYEATLVAFVNVSKVSGTWPASGSATLKISDGVDTVDLRIDSDTDIDGNPEPTWPQDVVGLGSQFSSSALDAGYQILPRYYAFDFRAPNTIPVELTSFKAGLGTNFVTLNWKTATETNNAGFEVQKGIDDKSFQKIGFVKGNGTVTTSKSYSFTDKNIGSSKAYYYRLKQIDLDGSFSYSDVVNVTIVNPSVYQLAQNYPNPFNPSTAINFALPVNAKVNVKVFNVLGKEVSQVVSGNLEAGSHTFKVDFSNLSSGIYFYSIEAQGIDGSTFRSTKKMTLMK